MNHTFSHFVQELERTQWLPPPELAHYHEGLLERLVRHAYENVPFHRERLACLLDSDGELDLSRWNEVPILERADAIAAGPAMRASYYPKRYGPIIESRTSGSTGNPLSVGANDVVPTFANAALTRMAGWFGLDLTRPLASITIYVNQEPPRYPEGRTYSGWSRASPDTLHHCLDLRTPVSDQLEWLARKRVPYLRTLPANAMALAYAVTPEEGRALGIEFIFTVGETVVDDARELIAERLGARLAGIYSCQEVGAIAMECPTKPHYHVMAENVLVEIIDDHGRDVPPGGLGRVVLTSLYNYSMPFIRYAIGDVATAGTGPCQCGRSLPVIARIDGRTRMAFVFRDGTRFWPRIWNVREMQAFVPCRECQVVQVDHERIEFRFVPDGSGRLPDTTGLTAYARHTMHPSVEVVPVPMDMLPRGPSGKFEHVISLVSAEMMRSRLP